MNPDREKALASQNYQRGHASIEPRRARMRLQMKCEIYCNGNAIARYVCAICHVGLCKKHAIIVKGGEYAGQVVCKEHRQGYV